MPVVRIGTRGSPLALAQAEEVKARLAQRFPELSAPEAIEIVVIKTTGDRILDQPLAEIGGKGLFTKEIDDALLERRIDLAAHSMKDVPTEMPDGLDIVCVLPREDVRDGYFSADGKTLGEMPTGALIGTASLRRQAQILAMRPDLRVGNIRGNVGTRLRKLAAGECAATLLAVAGLKRLNHTDPPLTAVLETDVMLPAVAQGAIGLAIRLDNEEMRARLAALNCPDSMICVRAERALLASLEGSCRTPIAALAKLSRDGQLALRALAATPDGRTVLTTERTGQSADAVAMGHDAGAELRRRLPEGWQLQHPTG